MADERPPAGGGFGRIESALNRLERRIDQVAREVEQVRTRQTREQPTTRVGRLPDAQTQTRRITQETGQVEGNTKAWERNAAARQQANKAGERRTAGGLIVPPGANAGRIATDPSAIARVNAQTAEANAKAREYAQLQSRVGAIRERAANTVGLESAALQRQVQVYGSSSQALRKHGALTTEFIQEAARGNVTFAEMRYQVGATIAKFAGWTAAAAAVYGALGAIQAVGSGAIESANGVNQLERVINRVNSGQAQRGFRQEASRFNLPISDVADAQYQLGKVFGDQNTALAGTPALLYAVKVGELSVADASKFLIATTNAYSLSVDELTPLLDKYNSLQNNLGVNIRDTAAGVAKAGGQFRAAGGDLTQLIAIVGAGTKVTGLSGDQFGTLLQRSAGLVGRPKNQEILKSFGLDPTKDITELYDAAFRLAPTLQRRQLVKLAEGLSTPQLAPRFTALLSRPDIYNKALNLVQPGASAGSAQRELDRQLGSISERAKRLRTDLELTGSLLAQGGGFVVPGAFIAGLDHALRLVNAIGEGVVGLPGPLGQALIPLITMVGLLKTIRRFNIGDSLAARTTPELAAFLNQRPETRARKLVGSGLDRELSFFQDERERVARQAAVASRRTVGQRDRLDRVLAITPQNAPAEQLREVDRQQKALNSARLVERELIEEEALLSQQIATTEARANRFRADVVKGRQSALGFARAEGIYLPATVATPTTQRPFRVGAGGQRTDTRAQALEARLGAAITGRDASLVFADRQRVFNALLENSGRDMGRIERVALSGASTAARAGSSAVRAGSAIKGVGLGIARLGGSLLAALGPMDLLLIGLIALPAIIDQVKGKLDRDAGELDAARNRAQRSSPTNLRAAAAQATKASHEQGHDFFANFGYPGLLYEQYATGGTVGGRRREQERANAALFSNIANVQDRARAAGKPVPGRRIADITADRNRVIAQARSGQITVAEAQKQINGFVTEYTQSYEHIVDAADPKTQAATEARIRRVIDDTRRGTARLSAGGGQDLYAGLDLKGVNAEFQAYLQTAQAGSQTNQNMRNAYEGYKRLRTLTEQDPTATNLAQLAQARSQYEDAAQGAAQKELDSALIFARTPGQRANAFQQYEHYLRSSLVRSPQRASQQALNRAQRDARQLVNAQGALHDARATAEDPGASSVDRAAAVFQIGRRLDQIERLKERVLASNRAAQRAGADQKDFEKKFRELRQQMKEEQFQLDEQQRGALTDLAVARTGDPFVRLRIQIANQGRNVAEAIRVFGRGSTEVATEMAKQQDLLNQRAEQDLQLRILKVQGRFAGSTDPSASVRGQLAAVQAELSARRANPRLRDSLKIQGLVNQQKDLQTQLAQQVASDARDLIEAQYAYKESRTENPVRLAQLELEKATALVKYARTPAEKLQARAQVNIAQRNALQARQQDSYDEIGFLFDIGKITQAEQHKRLQDLLKTIHGNRNLRRQIMRDLHNIEQAGSSDYNLDLDSLRLPTPYEIRRAIAGGSGGRNVTVHQNPVVHVNVNRKEDASAVGDVLDRTLNTNTRAALASAGLDV